MEILGRRIRKLLRETNTTQSELAKKARVTGASIGRYINGIREPKASTIIAIAKALGTSTDYLLGHTADADLISRQEALDEINHAIFAMGYTDDMTADEIAEKAMASAKYTMFKIIKELPSVGEEEDDR